VARSNPTGKLTLYRGGLSGSASHALTRALDPAELAREQEMYALEAAQDSKDIVAYLHGKPLSWEEIERLAADEDAAARGEVPLTRRHRWPYRAIAASILAVGIVGYGIAGFRAHSHAMIESARRDLDTRTERSVELTDTIALQAQNDSDAIAMFVVVPPREIEPVSYNVEPAVIEGDVKDALRMHAFPDIGVSAGSSGRVYLAGDVYSLDEVAKIKKIARHVEGVREVHFMHPNLLQASGPAYLGAIATNNPNIWGAVVTNVIPGSPADKAGIKRGDIIREFNGQTIADGRTLDSGISHCTPGDRVEVRVYRDGEDEIVGARLSTRTLVASR